MPTGVWLIFSIQSYYKDNFFKPSNFFHAPIFLPEQLLSSQEDESKKKLREQFPITKNLAI
jgi:hypothetical protein